MIQKLFKRNLIPLYVFLLIITISSLGITYLTSIRSTMIERSGVVMRTQPATNSDAIIEIPPNSEVTHLAEDSNWTKVRFDGVYEGWIPNWLIINSDLPSDQQITAQLTNELPVFSQEDENSEIIFTIPGESFIPINFESLGWIQITYNGEPGYVLTEEIILRSTPEVEAEIAREQARLAEEEARQRELEELTNTAIMRRDNEALFESADINSAVIYPTLLNQEFMIIDEIITDSDDFFYVEDSDGLRGYINQLAVSQPVFSMNHTAQPDAGNITEANILIDPGHGGEDPGTMSLDGSSYEKDYTLSVARQLQETLTALGANVELTREDDSWLDLEERTLMSNNQPADIFLSLHFDASWDPSWRGSATYYYHNADAQLALAVNDSLTDLDIPNLGVQFGNFQVIRENQQPALLLELGFMTNEQDLKNIHNPEFHQEAADAIANGLVNYFQQIESGL